MTARHSPVPVFLVGREHDRVAGVDVLRCLAPDLRAYTSFDDEEPLRAGVAVPVGSGAVGERDAVDADGCAGLVLGEPLDVGDAGERLRIGGVERDARRAKDLHLTNPSRLGIRTRGSVSWVRLSRSPTMPFRCSTYAVMAYTSSEESVPGRSYGIARLM